MNLLAATTYVPFLYPLPAWHDPWWMVLIVPLTAAISIVYKSVKCRTMDLVPRESMTISFWILLSLAAGAGALWLIVWLTE